jgi:hypothetical protein
MRQFAPNFGHGQQRALKGRSPSIPLLGSGGLVLLGHFCFGRT